VTGGKFAPTANTVAGNGMYLPATNELAFSTGGVQRVLVDSIGNVGLNVPSITGIGASIVTLQMRGRNNLNGGGIRMETANATSVGLQYLISSGYHIATSTNTPLLFLTNNTERMRITDAGNVGIGTTAPGNFNGVTLGDSILDVNGVIQVRGDATNGVAALQLGGDTFRKAAILSPVGTDDPYLAFVTASSGSASTGTERMRIDSAGNVGIGTATPGSKLEVFDTTNPIAPDSSFVVYGRRNGGANVMALRQALVGGLALTVDSGPVVRFQGYNGSGYDDLAALQAVAEENLTGSQSGGRLVFYTTPTGSTSVAERMRITSAGNVLVGTTVSPTNRQTLVTNNGYSVIAPGFGGNTGNGLQQSYSGYAGEMTGTSGTAVFTFTTSATRRSAFVKMRVLGYVNDNTPGDQAAAEYQFVLHQNTNTNVVTQNGFAAIYEQKFAFASNYTFAASGTTSATVTITNTDTSAMHLIYNIDILSADGLFRLDSVSVT
jgi:hypothetical protein